MFRKLSKFKKILLCIVVAAFIGFNSAKAAPNADDEVEEKDFRVKATKCFSADEFFEFMRSYGYEIVKETIKPTPGGGVIFGMLNEATAGIFMAQVQGGDLCRTNKS